MKRASSARTPGIDGLQALEQFGDAEARKCRRAGELSMLARASFLLARRASTSGMGNCVTLAPASRAVILLTPCFFTSSMRSTECIGRKVRLTPANSLLMRSSPGSSTTDGALAEHEVLHLDEPEQVAMADLAGVDLVNLALIHEHNAENVTGCHGSDGDSLLI